MSAQKGRYHRLNLQHRMMLWFALIIVGLLVCVLAYLHLRITGEMREQVDTSLESTCRLCQTMHQLRGRELVAQCENIAKFPGLIDAVARCSQPDTQDRIGEYASGNHPDVVVVVDAQGGRLASWAKGRSAPEGVGFLDGALAAALHPASQDPNQDPDEGRESLEYDGTCVYQTACARIRSHGRTLGALALGLAIDNAFVDRYLKGVSGAEVTFFAALPGSGEDGVCVASTLSDEQRQRLPRVLHAIGRRPLRFRVQGPKEGSYAVRLGENTEFLSLSTPIKDENKQVVGSYLIQRPLHEEMQVIDRMQRSLLLVGLFAILAAAGASYALANGVGRHIMRVVRAAEGLSGGDWSQRVPLEGPDELRVLAEAFNRMAARLQGWDAELRAEVSLRTEELNRALTRLDANLRQMRQFHADASHELRTPLTIMRGEVEVALRTQRSPIEYQRVLASILEEMNRVSAIVDHLLMLARADSGQIPVERKPVRICQVLRDLQAQGMLLARPKQISVSLSAADEVTVLGDGDKLRQLFLNLMDNAIKYTPEKGSVNLSVGTDNGFAVVSVKDTGIGIAEADIPHVFGRFFRADRARSREMGGSGLGLAICQWIIEAHQGWIDVQSAVGEGSTFTVYIPRVVTPEEPELPAQADALDAEEEPAIV